ncbi:MAG TPA: hypothetical protein VJ696_13030, partial [Rhodanobacteraceae bacterium]|nr:hypothetical protein [Rhodanobacteraceae bacterium]
VVVVQNTTPDIAHIVVHVEFSGAGNISATIHDAAFDPSHPEQNCLRYANGFTTFQPIDVAPGGSIWIVVMPEGGAQLPRPWSVSFGGTTPVTLQ